jgi:hypothetical protein
MNNDTIMGVVQTALLMEWYGIHIEDTREFGDITYQYVSVPESSTIEVEDQELNSKIKTSDGLVDVAKNMLVKMQVDTCKAIDDDDDFIQYVKDNVSDWIKVYARVRKGEVWTREMGDVRVKELTKDLNKAAEYKEV